MRKSTGEYPPDWQAIAERVKTEAGWACVRCGRRHEPSAGYTLTVHHLDMDPSNCRWWNLVPLCQRCHLVVQAKVHLDRVWLFEHAPWFRRYVAGYYAHVYGQPDDRESVFARIDELIAMGQGRSV